jgi:glyceraldehyde-3-phosphate dehydrogenase (ferredoxin)
MVPNQYWTPGVLSPMAIMGKYYMHYGNDLVLPRQLGQINAERFQQELIMDNLGICRFHRGWAEEMGPEIIESLWGLKKEYLRSVRFTATRINSRNASQYWENSRSTDYVSLWLKRKRDVEGETAPELHEWIERFEKDPKEAGLTWWYEIHKGITESLCEFS